MDENIKDTKKKRCFVITPIGDEKSEIRRHIDGIIDEAIVPALGEAVSYTHLDVYKRQPMIRSIIC